jgi:hypothetical protein
MVPAQAPAKHHYTSFLVSRNKENEAQKWANEAQGHIQWHKQGQMGKVC